MTEAKLKKGINSERNNEDIIKLNVGGKPFYATYGSLKSSSYFTRLLADENQLDYINKDEIFIDHTACLFTEIMYYLKNGKLDFDEEDDLESLKNEAEFYHIYDLSDKVSNMIRFPPSEKAKR